MNCSVCKEKFKGGMVNKSYSTGLCSMCLDLLVGIVTTPIKVYQEMIQINPLKLKFGLLKGKLEERLKEN